MGANAEVVCPAAPSLSRHSGARVVQLQVVPTDDVTGTPLFANAVVTNVVVSDDDGPALTVQLNA